MKDDTNMRNINGSWYCRIPPSFVRHLGLEGEWGEAVDAMIQDEDGKKGKYCSIWKKEK